jgi:hypothetical protein
VKYKQQRNKVNNLKKQAKKKFYANINENLDELKSANGKLYWKTMNMLIIISCPTALSTFNVEIISIISCSQTSISERTFKHLQSKSGKTLFSSFEMC